MSTEAQKRASKKYYEKHREYYKQKSTENLRKLRQERNDLRKKVEELERIIYGTK